MSDLIFWPMPVVQSKTQGSKLSSIPRDRRLESGPIIVLLSTLKSGNDRVFDLLYGRPQLDVELDRHGRFCFCFFIYKRFFFKRFFVFQHVINGST